MLVLLPPSETKAEGGDGAPLDLDALSFPELNPARRKLADALVELAGDVPASLAALGLSARQEAEVARNAAIHHAATLPALRRYTGVLYDALDVATFSRAEWRRAAGRLAVASALFGVVRGADPIPGYRCSGGTVVPGIGPLRELWRPALEPVLAELSATGELVLDLRSGSYASLARIPDAVTVRVVTDDGDRRTTVSHFNKAHKGRLARVLALAGREPATIRQVLSTAAKAGLRLSQAGPHELELVAE